MKIEMGEDGLPTTFVPGRNLMFLTAAAALGYRRGIADLVGGMCETDFSGYPDCRDETVQATARALSLGLAREVRVHTPLMWIDKAATWRMAEELGGEGAGRSDRGRNASPAMRAIAATAMTGAMAAASVRPANCARRGYERPELDVVRRDHDRDYASKKSTTPCRARAPRAGRAAVFLRFAGCNLWSGLEKDRAEAVCRFCDTDFVGTDGPGGGKFADAAQPGARRVRRNGRNSAEGKPYVVCTGGEPLLQLDKALVAALHDVGFEIGIETNGTLLPPAGIDWICVSPKADARTEADAWR